MRLMPERQQKKKYTDLLWTGTPKTILNNGKKCKKETAGTKSESKSKAEAPGKFGRGYSRGAFVL